MVGRALVPVQVARITSPPDWSLHVTHASDFESGAQLGPNSPTSAEETRTGWPFGRSITYTRSRAENASFLPSGEGAMSRTWCDLNVAFVSTRYAKRTSGPISILTLAVNGIFAGVLLSIGTRQISPP